MTGIAVQGEGVVQTAPSTVVTRGAVAIAKQEPTTAEIDAKYYDANGCELFVSQGLGAPDGPWGVFRRKKTGSLQRIKPIPMVESRGEAQQLLTRYAARHKEIRIEQGGFAS